MYEYDSQKKMLTETQVKVILILLDNRGHAGWEISEHLEMEHSNLNPILKELEEEGIIYQGEPRKSSNKQKKKGNYKEFPYYLAIDLNGLKIIMREIATSKKVFDTGFILEIIENSKYIEAMRKIFGEELNECVEEELRKNYPPYSDPFFVRRIEPSLVEGTYVYGCIDDLKKQI
ncbi:MAG: hypothetical protein WA137_01890 [Methanothrix sp.]